MIKKIVKLIVVFIFGNKNRLMTMRKGLFKGIKLEINLANQLSLIFGTPEIHLQEILKKYITKNAIVFDIGANIGYVSIAMSRIVGDGGKVFAFEAIPSTAERCRKNLELNTCNNVQLVNKALSDECGKVEFRIPEGGNIHSMASMVWHKNQSDVLSVEVDAITIDLDQQFKDLMPSFLKIDVEGAEGKVILGMQHMISRCYPVIFIECSKAGRQIVWDLLKLLNYKCFHALDLEVEIKDFEMYFSDDFLWIPPVFHDN
jgi:FkbM family methyltransferase